MKCFDLSLCAQSEFLQSTDSMLGNFHYSVDISRLNPAIAFWVCVVLFTLSSVSFSLVLPIEV